MKHRFEVDAPVFGELHLIEPDTDALRKNMPRPTSDRQQRAAAQESAHERRQREQPRASTERRRRSFLGAHAVVGVRTVT